MPPESLASLSFIGKHNSPEVFARKVVVIAYSLIKNPDNECYEPYFLLSIICPKQKYKNLTQWQDAKTFRMPSGYSLIKGTREMIYAGQRLDIPPGFGRYFNPSVWDNEFQVDSRHREIVACIDGLTPVVSTALVEAREEAGIKSKHIKRLFDLGVLPAKLEGRQSQYHCIAMELHDMKIGKAVDSLALNYFSYQELKWGKGIRFRYNIPLIRPSHFLLVKKIRKRLTAIYQTLGQELTFKGHQPLPERQLQLQTEFRKLLKRSAKGHFVSVRGDHETTIKRVIKRSKRSRRKIQLLKKMINQ